MINLYVSSQYRCILDDMFSANPSVAQRMAKNRFCGYRNVVFWLYPGLRRRERKPLPACVYKYIQNKFPPTENDIDAMGWRFSDFTSL